MRFGLLLLLLACSSQLKKVKTAELFETEQFSFRVPMEGDWYRMKAGHFVFGKKLPVQSHSMIAEVEFGKIYEREGEMNVNPKFLDNFRESIEREGKNDRVRNKKSTFALRPYKGTQCLFFKQTARDHIPDYGDMNLTYNGMVCLNPHDGNKYVWMAMSQRVPVSDKLLDMSQDEALFFESLRFK